MDKTTWLIILDIVVVIFFLVMGSFAYTHWKDFKVLGSDPCAYCMNKTGAICVDKSFLPQPKKEYIEPFNTDILDNITIK